MNHFVISCLTTCLQAWSIKPYIFDNIKQWTNMCVTEEASRWPFKQSTQGNFLVGVVLTIITRDRVDWSRVSSDQCPPPGWLSCTTPPAILWWPQCDRNTILSDGICQGNKWTYNTLDITQIHAVFMHMKYLSCAFSLKMYISVLSKSYQSHILINML